MVVTNTETDLVLGCVCWSIDMYCKCRHLDSARRSVSIYDGFFFEMSIYDGLIRHAGAFFLSALGSVYGYSSCRQSFHFDKVEN